MLGLAVAALAQTTVTQPCYFANAGWCRGVDDCSVGFQASPTACWKVECLLYRELTESKL